MSRVGKKPIAIPVGVDVSVKGTAVSVKGPKGSLTCEVHPRVTVSIEQTEAGSVVQVGVKDASDAFGRSIWGTTRANIANLIKGVTEGFSKSLEVIGVGYKVNVQGQKIVLDVGFSHHVDVAIPVGITATVEKNILTLAGTDNITLGQFAAYVRSIRKPEPYGGKGIKYTTEQIRRKAGKTAKTGE